MTTSILGDGVSAGQEGIPPSDLKSARAQSTNKLHLAWQSIFDRYTKGAHLAEGRDDVVDLETGEIVEDAGFLNGSEEVIDIGTFGLPGSMGEFDESEDDDRGTVDRRRTGSVSEDQMSVDSDSDGEGRHVSGISSAARKMDLSSECSSSEDELGNWDSSTFTLPPVSDHFKRLRRARDDLAEDLRHFLQDEAASVALEAKRSTTLTPTSSRAKRESVRPDLYASSPFSNDPHGDLHRREPSTAIAHRTYAKLPTSASSVKLKPLASKLSDAPITPAIRMAGGNSILSQAVLCEDDSSDDDLTLLTPTTTTRNYTSSTRSAPLKFNSLPRVKLREESELPYTLPSPPPSRSRSPQKAQKISTRPSCRSTPVVEIPVRTTSTGKSRRSDVAARGSHPDPAPLIRPSLPSSFSAPSGFALPTPPSSQKSENASHLFPEPPEGGFRNTPSAQHFVKKYVATSPELECVLHTSGQTAEYLPTEQQGNVSHPQRASQQSTRTRQQTHSRHLPSPSKHSVANSNPSSTSPQRRKKGTEPWRIKISHSEADGYGFDIKTPPASCGMGTAGAASARKHHEDDAGLDVAPARKQVLLTTTAIEVTDDSDNGDEDDDDDDDDILLISPTRPVTSVTRQQSIIVASHNRLSWPTRTCSIVSDSPMKQRLGSVARALSVRPPPGDDGDESDDPLAI